MQAKLVILSLSVAAVAAVTTWWWSKADIARTAGEVAAEASLRPEMMPHGPRFSPATDAPATARNDSETRDSSMDQEIARLGSAASPREEPLRQRYVLSSDLYRFVHDLLPAATAGEGGSQYYIYLALDQCRPYLRTDPQGAQELYETAMRQLNERPMEERMLWQSEYLRCRSFAGADLSLIKEALGADLPGAEIEYASVWFQRAVDRGHPPALAEEALRANSLSTAERVERLQEAAASGNPEVYWLLFNHLRDADSADAAVNSTAWLLAACRAGYDCTSQADWFRLAVCGQQPAGCRRKESAIAYYWYALPAPQRELALARAEEIRHPAEPGQVQFDLLPLLPIDTGNDIVAPR
ncbi:MAG: hypothetical protein ACRETN_02110 [Nevskiales bacterium]